MARDTALAPKTAKRKQRAILPRVSGMKTNGAVAPVSKYREWRLFYFKPNGHNGTRRHLPRTDTITRLYQGLCKSCELRKACPLSITDGGVWRCEDYR